VALRGQRVDEARRAYARNRARIELYLEWSRERRRARFAAAARQRGRDGGIRGDARHDQCAEHGTARYQSSVETHGLSVSLLCHARHAEELAAARRGHRARYRGHAVAYARARGRLRRDRRAARVAADALERLA